VGASLPTTSWVTYAAGVNDNPYGATYTWGDWIVDETYSYVLDTNGNIINWVTTAANTGTVTSYAVVAGIMEGKKGDANATQTKRKRTRFGVQGTDYIFDGDLVGAVALTGKNDYVETVWAYGRDDKLDLVPGDILGYIESEDVWIRVAAAELFESVAADTCTAENVINNKLLGIDRYGAKFSAWNAYSVPAGANDVALDWDSNALVVVLPSDDIAYNDKSKGNYVYKTKEAAGFSIDDYTIVNIMTGYDSEFNSTVAVLVLIAA
jgi:hypothetical protein